MSPGALVAKAAARPWLLALAVLVVGHTVLIATRTYQPGGDWAFIELRTRDVFSANPPLTGAWSRFGWNHPGPLMYYALAIPHLLTGASWQGLWLGAMLLNLAAIVVALWLVSRQGRILTGAFAVAACWTVAGGTPHLFTDPWNASVVIVGVITMAAAVLAVRTGDRRGVAVALVVFVAAAQTHAAYGVMLLPATVVVLVIGFRRWPRFTLAWSGAAAVLCLPTLIDTFLNWPGNLWRALRFTATSDEPAVGAAETLRVLGRSTSLSAVGDPRLPSFVSVVSGTPWGVFPFAGAVALTVAYIVGRRSAWTSSCRAVEAVALLWLGGAVMTWRTRGPLLIWLTTWTVALVALTWCVAGAVLVRWIAERAHLGERSPRWRTVVGGVAVVAVTTAFAAVNVAGSVGVGYPFQEYTAVVDQFAADAGGLAAEPIAIDMEGADYVAGAVQSGLIARLEADGGSPLARPDQALQMGDRRAAPSLDGRRLLVQVEARSAPPEGASVISTWDPLDAAERAEADGLMDTLGALLDEAGLGERKELLTSDLAPIAALDAPTSVTNQQAAFERLAELHSRGARIVLYLVEPAA